MNATRANTPVIRHLNTPIGDIWIAATDAGLAVLTMNAGNGAEGVREQLSKRGLANKPGSQRLADEASDQLREYFEGERKSFDVAVDLRGMPAFTSSVLKRLQQVSFGETMTYGELAKAVGNPHASRAVGQANGHNPVAIVVPCHRIVAGNGLGGFSGGLHLKRWLLKHEGRADLI